jgi:hypothetical protein
MRHFIAFLVITAFTLVSLPLELIAQGNSASRAQGPKATAAHGPKTPASSGGKTTSTRGSKTTPAQGAKSNTARGPKTTTRAPKATSTKSTNKEPKPTSATTAATSARGKRSGDTANATTATRTTKKSSGSTETAPTTRMSALPKNKKLVERLRTLLKNNPDMNEAARGFSNQGQFVAAVHASANHGLSFTELKKRMVDKRMSLGQAVKHMRRNIDSDAAASLAVQQANQDLAVTSPKRRTRQ